MRAAALTTALLLASSLTVVPATLPVAAAPAPTADPPVLTITDDATGPAVPSTMVGANQRWNGDADGAWEPATNTRNDRTVRLAADLGIGAARYPGGTVANMFDVDAMLKGRCQVNAGGAGGDFDWFAEIKRGESEFTLDRSVAFLKAVEAADPADRLAPTINLMVPMVNSSPEEARILVERLIDLGQTTINVELGNEPYLTRQRYWRALDKRTRVQQYIEGGVQRQRPGKGAYRNNDRLFRADTCDLQHPATSDGSEDQKYRSRFGPFARPPRVWVIRDGRAAEWTYRADLATARPRAHVFTVPKGSNRVVFGDGTHGAIPAAGAGFRIEYAVRHDGYLDFRAELKDLAADRGATINVCSSWAKTPFLDAIGDRPYDCLAVHQYANVKHKDGKEPDYSVEAWNRLMESARVEVEQLRELRRRIGGTRFLMVTEFGSLQRAWRRQRFQFGGTILRARLLVSQVRNAAAVSNFSNFSTLFTQTDQGRYLSDSGYLLRMIRRHAGQRPVATSLSGGAAGLSVLATRDGDRATLLVVNHTLETSYLPEIRLEGRSTDYCFGILPMRGRTNTEASARPGEREPRILGTERWGTWRANDRLEQGFPAHSITQVTLAPKVGTSCPVARF